MRVLAVIVVLIAPLACPAPAAGEGEGEGEGEGGPDVDESEPNDGATDTEVNDLAVGAIMHGAIGSASDVDIFRVDTTPGALYRVTLDVPAGSPLDGHLTVLDAGRGGGAPGADYVRLERAPDGPTAALSFLAFGEGGHLVVVRDARAVDGAPEGGAAYTYALTVGEVAPAPATLAFPGTLSDALDDVGGVKLYAFTANANADFTVDLSADGDLDARLFVYADSERDWVARNDDRSAGDVNPLLDAFFPVGGSMLLVVESAAESATDLGYTLTTTGN